MNLSGANEFLRLLTERLPPSGEGAHALVFSGVSPRVLVSARWDGECHTYLLDEADILRTPGDIADEIVAMRLGALTKLASEPT